VAYVKLLALKLSCIYLRKSIKYHSPFSR